MTMFIKCPENAYRQLQCLISCRNITKNSHRRQNSLACAHKSAQLVCTLRIDCRCEYFGHDEGLKLGLILSRNRLRKSKEASNETLSLITSTEDNLRLPGHGGTIVLCILSKNQLFGVDNNHQEGSLLASPQQCTWGIEFGRQPLAKTGRSRV
jgi:hypothetical protein